MTMQSALWGPPPKRVAIFRALNLGDLLCTMPAWRALRRALPDAWITLIGLESAKPVVERFHQYIDELVLFPGDPAFPEQEARVEELPGFYQRMRARRFDLVLQMHGSGRQSNLVVSKIATERWAGFVPDHQQEEPGRLMPWPDDLPEIKRYLSLLSYLGLPADDPALEFPLTADDQAEASLLSQNLGLDLARTVFIHCGARMESRRWPLDRYAAVADSLADQGWAIALTGSKDEAELVEQLQHRLRTPAVNLCGATSLGALAALLSQGRLLICNDTGISHIAAAVRLPSIVIASGSDVMRWAPLDADMHTVLYQNMSWRPCAYQRCPVGHPCALAVTVDQVLDQAASRLDKKAANMNALCGVDNG